VSAEDVIELIAIVAPTMGFLVGLAVGAMVGGYRNAKLRRELQEARTYVDHIHGIEHMYNELEWHLKTIYASYRKTGQLEKVDHLIMKIPEVLDDAG